MHVLAFKISIFGLPNQNWVWGVYIYHKYWDNTRFRQKKLHVYDFQVRLSVAAFLAFLVLKFWKCGKMWPSISKWTYTCQKNLKIQVRKYSAFDLAFLTFVGLFKILLRSLRCKKSGGMQESCTLAFYHQKQFSLKISHFESVWYRVSNQNLGLQWSVESMINILACLVFPYGHAEFMYFDSKNLPRFGMKIFENLIFASNTYNMYIKWKLK